MPEHGLGGRSTGMAPSDFPFYTDGPYSETCHEDSLNKTVWGKPLNRRNTELLDSDTLKINKAKLARPIGMYSWLRPLSMQLQFDH